MKDEAWTALKQLKRGSKEIVELAGEAEKLAKRLHPNDEEAAERHAVDEFLSALDRSLVAEVKKLGCNTMKEVVAAARKIERILGEQGDSKMERLILSMQEQIRILTKDLKIAHEQMAPQSAPAAPTAAFANLPPVVMAAAQPPPPTHPPTTAPLPPLATAQPPPYPPARHLYPDYGEEEPYYRPPCRQQERRTPRCFLCGEEGHFVSHCHTSSVLQRLLRQQERDPARGPPRGQVLELPAVDGEHGSH